MSWGYLITVTGRGEFLSKLSFETEGEAIATLVERRLAGRPVPGTMTYTVVDLDTYKKEVRHD